MFYTKSKIIKQNYKHYTTNKHTLPQAMHEAYKTPSQNKVHSYWCWRTKITQYGAYDIRILSANCQRYTIGYLFDKDGETFFGYITPQYHRYCNITEL